VSGRTQHLKGVANEAVGKTRGSVSHAVKSGTGEAKAANQVAKGKAQKATGKVRRAAKS
jgi:uncharacterized protein YjbJ (UPF0337 family)